jgi:hypothetical protein
MIKTNSLTLFSLMLRKIGKTRSNGTNPIYFLQDHFLHFLLHNVQWNVSNIKCKYSEPRVVRWIFVLWKLLEVISFGITWLVLGMARKYLAENYKICFIPGLYVELTNPLAN